MVYNLPDFINSFINSFLSINTYSILLGAFVVGYIAYRLGKRRGRVKTVDSAYKTLYATFYIKLASFRTNIQIKKIEHGKRNFKKLNNESKKNNNISMTAKKILDVSDEMRTMLRRQDHREINTKVISEYLAIDEIEEQIRLIENSGLGFGKKKKIRQARVARLYYELACAKISFVQSVLEDMKKISWSEGAKDKETKETIRFLIKVCKRAKKKEVSKVYGIEESKGVKSFNERDALAG
jgi:hypothetical protein